MSVIPRPSATLLIKTALVAASTLSGVDAWANELTSQQADALRIIRETADGICYTVEQRGGETEKELNGKIQGKIDGALSRIVGLGVSGSGQIRDESYRGVLRDQLSSALVHSANCKRDVFHTLVEKMVPSLVKSIPIAPGLPTTRQLPAPNSVNMVDAIQILVYSSNNSQIGYFKFQLYRCGASKSGNNITCLIAASYQAQPYQHQHIDYTIDSRDSIGLARFIDNHGGQHSIVGAYFVDGRGNHQKSINMEKSTPVWLALEFEGPSDDVSSGRIVFPDRRAILHVKSVSKQ